jgi:hypothetical protein
MLFHSLNTSDKKRNDHKHEMLVPVFWILFYEQLLLYRAIKLICNRVIHGFESVCLFD